MPYSYYNYTASVRGYTLVKVTNPANTASWQSGETINLLTADGTPRTFWGQSQYIIYDNQPNATQISDLPPSPSQSYSRNHPTVGNAAWSTNTESPGYSPGIAFGNYPSNGADSSALWGTQRDRMIASDEFIIPDYNLTGVLTPGTLIYNNNYVTVAGRAIDLTGSWTQVANTSLSGTANGNAFAQIITIDKNRSIFYSFAGESSPGIYDDYIFWCSGTQTAGIMDLSPWYRQDADKNSWLGDQSRASTAFPSAGGAALTIPVLQGIAYGRAAVDTNTTTMFYGGGIKPVYVGSTSSIYGTREIYGWNYDPTTGLLTGSAFLAGLMPMGRYKHEMFVANGFLYLVGGATSSYDLSVLGSALTHSFHYHIDRAYINHDGRLNNWASCLYEMPMGPTLENTGSGLVDGTAFIHPDNPVPGENSFIYVLGGVKGWSSGTSFFSRSSGQMWSAKLSYVPGAAVLNNPNRLGVAGEIWMGPAQGEYLTTGVQLGPNDIKPALPMMENIYQQNMVSTLPVDKQVLDAESRVIGYRPGLRGTEMSGEWKIRMATTPGDFDATGGPNATWSHLTSSQVYLRQVRLEFLVDSTQGYGDIQMFNPARERLYKKSSVGLRNGKRLVDIISGSAWWDSGVSYIYTYVQDEYGRTVGLTTNATASDDYAVFTQITGALAVHLTGTPSWFLNPPPGEGVAGLPYIPLSSASFGEASNPVVYNPADTSDMINATVGQQLPTPADNTLTAYLARIKAIQKTQDVFEQQLYNTGTEPYFGP